MKRKYLPLYKKWCITGELPERNGLCNEFEHFNSAVGEYVAEPAFSLVKPVRTTKTYWGFEGRETIIDSNVAGTFTPLRQNLVLLMAALNDEL